MRAIALLRYCAILYVYTKINPQTAQKTLSALENCENGPTCTQRNGFSSAKDAVLKTRYQDSAQLSQTIDSRINEASNNPYNNPNIQSRIDELNQTLSVISAGKTIAEQTNFAKSHLATQQNPQALDYINQMEAANTNPVSALSIPRVTISSLQTQDPPQTT